MKNYIVKCSKYAFSIITIIFAFVPEAWFSFISAAIMRHIPWATGYSSYTYIIISRVLFFTLVLIGVSVCLKNRTKVTIKGDNYYICVEYGDIFQGDNCKRVITFDECFTTKIGSAPADINFDSICGKYLRLHPDLNDETMASLIESAQVHPKQTPLKYKSSGRYESGTIVPYGNDLLMAFAPLDEHGKGRFPSRDAYLACLDKLWKNIENHYSEMDVCIPVLGSGTTVFDGGSGASISQQDLLDMIIWSYRLSSHKIKAPHKLRIICQRKDNFSLNHIGES